MSYGIESLHPEPFSQCVTIDVAASRCNVLAEQITEYAREGLLIPLKTSNGISYYTNLDYEWICTLQRLRDEAHLSFDSIRRLLIGGCECWKFRHCDFHNVNACPMITDPSKPCWANRALWSVFVSYPCYGCLAYRSLPRCGAVRSILHDSGVAAQSSRSAANSNK